jgi:hypothetical protein
MKISTVKVVRSEDYDWIAVYRDGKLLDQGHSIQEEDLIKLLGFELEHEVWNEQMFNENGGMCPPELA